MHIPPEMSEFVYRRVYQLVAEDHRKMKPERTRRINEAATYKSRKTIYPYERDKYDDLARLANFCLGIKSAVPEISRKKIFRRADFSFDEPFQLGPRATLARLFDFPTKHQSRLVLVEWVAPRGIPNEELLEEVKVLWFTLSAEKPDRMLLPGALGIIYDELYPGDIGIVLQLPPHIRGSLATKSPLDGQLASELLRSSKTIAAQRKPTTLRDLILHKAPNGLDLKIRFQLAKKLLDAMFLMHGAGWCHRSGQSSIQHHSSLTNQTQKHPLRQHSLLPLSRPQRRPGPYDTRLR